MHTTAVPLPPKWVCWNVKTCKGNVPLNVHSLSLALALTPKTNTKIPTAKSKGAPFHILTQEPSFHPHARLLSSLSHRDPHLHIMPFLPVPFITRPIVSIGRRTIRKIVQIQLSVRGRFQVVGVLRWVDIAKVTTGCG